MAMGDSLNKVREELLSEVRVPVRASEVAEERKEGMHKHSTLDHLDDWRSKPEEYLAGEKPAPKSEPEKSEETPSEAQPKEVEGQAKEPPKEEDPYAALPAWARERLQKVSGQRDELKDKADRASALEQRLALLEQHNERLRWEMEQERARQHETSTRQSALSEREQYLSQFDDPGERLIAEMRLDQLELKEQLESIRAEKEAFARTMEEKEAFKAGVDNIQKAAASALKAVGREGDVRFVRNLFARYADEVRNANATGRQAPDILFVARHLDGEDINFAKAWAEKQGLGGAQKAAEVKAKTPPALVTAGSTPAPGVEGRDKVPNFGMGIAARRARLEYMEQHGMLPRSAG